MKFLLENAFTTPTWMIDEEILRRIEPVGVIDRIHTAQNRVLTTLLNSARFARLVEQETLDGNLAYSPVEFLARCARASGRNWTRRQVKIDAYRRELQRSYLQAVNTQAESAARAAATALRPRLPEGFALPRVDHERRREADVSRGTARPERLDRGGDCEDHGSRDQGAPGSRRTRSRRSWIRSSPPAPAAPATGGGRGGDLR